jgi:hypothetical protein
MKNPNLTFSKQFTPIPYLVLFKTIALNLFKAQEKTDFLC